METFSLANRPENLTSHRKKTVVHLAFIDEPFRVRSQEGSLEISPDTVDDWDGGYYIAYPDDGSKPYAIAPSYVAQNYAEAPKEGASLS